MLGATADPLRGSQSSLRPPRDHRKGRHGLRAGQVLPQGQRQAPGQRGPLPGGRPRPQGRGIQLLDRQARSHQRAVQGVRGRHGLRHFRRESPQQGRLSQRPRRPTRSGGNGIRPAPQKHRPAGRERPVGLVGLPQERMLEAPRRGKILHQEPHGPPGRMRQHRRRQGLCQVGGQAPPHGSGMGAGRPGRTGSEDVRLGR